MAIGIGLCAEASKHGLDQAKEFMIGLYMVGFGAFAAATEFVYMPKVVRYMMLFDSYFGKGCFYIFWGFLMWGSRPVWIIAALVFIGVGICYIIGSCSVSAPPVYICGERPADAKPGVPPRAPESSRPAPPGDPVWPPPPEEDPYRMPSQQQVQQQASDAAVSWAKENPKDAMKLAKAASKHA